ncbi:hypothetical protein E2C01_033085 [Portunus trituberculatus]|uniref:Uncharacterized protein n=1 Tax=Portunus trituberculatus TaxID=210409 RepID=A0A5B7F227_PORTR|nr:hypothetical protein [Portunus trituberculatus]
MEGEKERKRQRRYYGRQGLRFFATKLLFVTVVPSESDWMSQNAYVHSKDVPCLLTERREIGRKKEVGKEIV